MDKRLLCGVLLATMVTAGCAGQQKVETAIREIPAASEQSVQPGVPQVQLSDAPAPASGKSEPKNEAAPATQQQAAAPETQQQAAAPSAALAPLPDEALETAHFEVDSYLLQTGERELLVRDADRIRKSNGKSYVLEGFCDERGDDEYNLALGQKRAQAVFSYLVNLGLSRDRFTTMSYGKERPVDLGHSESAWQKNRRVEIVPK
jgi:peptidoglycan-associated lipoprotein